MENNSGRSNNYIQMNVMGDVRLVLSWNIMGGDGKHNSDMTKSLQATYHALKKANISDDIIIELNDSGVTFDEIADFLDRYQNWLASKHNVPGGI